MLMLVFTRLSAPYDTDFSETLETSVTFHRFGANNSRFHLSNSPYIQAYERVITAGIAERGEGFSGDR